MINVFSIDPGVTTGWCFIKGANLSALPHGESDLHLIADQVMGDENQQAKDLFKIIKHLSPVVVVIEDFVPRKLDQSRHFLSPVRVSAKLEMLLWMDNRKWWKQMPSLAMSTITDDHLIECMHYHKGKPHANDAVRHGLTFLRTALNKPELADDLMSFQGI